MRENSTYHKINVARNFGHKMRPFKRLFIILWPSFYCSRCIEIPFCIGYLDSSISSGSKPLQRLRLLLSGSFFNATEFSKAEVVVVKIQRKWNFQATTQNSNSFSKTVSGVKLIFIFGTTQGHAIVRQTFFYSSYPGLLDSSSRSHHAPVFRLRNLKTWDTLWRWRSQCLKNMQNV